MATGFPTTAGVAASPYDARGYVKPKKSPVDTAYDTYGTAAKAQGQDYTDIMNRYKSLYDTLGSGGGNGNSALNLNYDYTVPTYRTSADYTDAVKNLRTLAGNGGYTDQDIADIRARAISPIRAVYGNAQTNLNRQRRLQGGYSPNYTAATTKMAREMSSQLSDATTNANAQIAQQIAQNKVGLAGQYADTTSHEQDSRNQFDLATAEMGNKYGLDKLNANIQSYQIPIQAKLAALGGMAGLYGTTPAVTSLMQHGAQNEAQMDAANRQQDFNNKGRLFELFGR